MFTGLIEDVGTIIRLRESKGSTVLTVEPAFSLRRTAPGSSIAVNGACLTVVNRRNRAFTADISPETLKRTNLKLLKAGSLVNLERSLSFNDRLGGHLVTGHIDGVGTVESIEKRGEFTFFTMRVPVQLGSLLVSKGSVAVDGISLTVNKNSRRLFSVAIIPFTFEHTNLRLRRVGDKVNIETDLIGKYVHSFLKGRI